MSRWLVTGGGGQLATRLARRLADCGEDAVVLARADLDITDAAAVAAQLERHAPDVVVNAAAYTAVDAAETDEDAAAAVNVTGPQVLARAVARRDGRFVHVSTDYVFDGTADRPYEPDDPTGPRTAYGRTKLAGEQAVLAELPTAHIVRTAWVYGGPGANFVDTMLSLERTRETVDVVADQIGSPTYAADLAGALVAVGQSADVAPGVLHYANAGQASWFDLAREAFRCVGADPERVRPTTSAAFVRPAPRPGWSVLSTAAWTAAGLPAPRPWQDAVADHVASRPR